MSEIAQELKFQLKYADYQESYRFAFLAAVTANMQRGKKKKAIKAEDFVGKLPERNKKDAKPKDDLASLIKLAKAKGLWVPGS
ncbi:MAG: hypothetical protein M0021_09815 [Clostridia bacterium]|nr:hypothetical protein [Clostridia bacterium]